MELKKAKNEVLRKIGRNMLLFQQMEGMLKYLVAHGRFSGYASELKTKHENHIVTVRKQTMGQLVGQFLENTYSKCEKNSEEQIELKEAFFSFSFSVETDAANYETQKQAMASIVADRNELTHHLLPRFNPNSTESCLEIDQYLDRQREKLLPQWDMLKRIADALREGRKIHGEFLGSDEGKKQFQLSWLRQSTLVILLADISTQMARSDGRTLLNIAGELIRKHAPEERVCLKEKYGHKTLKELIIATELFEIFEEPTDKGGIRVLYRLKSDRELQMLEK